MNHETIELCMDFIRFNQDSEGFELESETDETLRKIFDEDITPDLAVENLIERHNLETTFKPLADNNVFYPETNTQVNYFNIKDPVELKKIEMKIYPIRLAELIMGERPRKFDLDLLKDIHSTLFGDIFPNAGIIRKFSAYKRTVFCQPEFIENVGKTIFSKLLKDRYLIKKNRRDFINDFAYYMGEVEALHPFIDGNGRAIKAFFNFLALNANYQIQWFEIDSDDLIEADIGAIDGEYQLLVDVLSSAIPEN